MKKWTLGLTLLCALACACASGDRIGTQESAGTPAASAQAAETPTQTETVQSLSGTVYDASMNTITVVTDDRRLYLFARGDGVTQATDDGIVIGFPVTVDYAGALDDTTLSQSAVALSVRVSNFDGLTSGEKAAHILLTLSLEEEVGQMFIVRCPKENAAENEAYYQFGGYILYGSDFADETPENVTARIAGIQASARVPMLIGVDEEGGAVNRISAYPQFRAEPFAAAQTLYAEGGFDAIDRDTADKCDFLKALGVNVNFAPVCDVPASQGDYIYPRAFGLDAALTAQYVARVVETMNAHAVGCVLKHFPGYGNNPDTHTGSALDTRTWETFEASDLLPFEAGIDAGAGAVLVCHNVIACLDADAPASLSPAVHAALRGELGFDGVVITDDLAMEAIQNFASAGDAALLAVDAGNDMLCCKNFADAYAAVLGAAQNGDIVRARIDESVLRILTWKIDLGLL